MALEDERSVFGSVGVPDVDRLIVSGAGNPPVGQCSDGEYLTCVAAIDNRLVGECERIDDANQAVAAAGNDPAISEYFEVLNPGAERDDLRFGVRSVWVHEIDGPVLTRGRNPTVG